MCCKIGCFNYILYTRMCGFVYVHHLDRRGTSQARVRLGLSSVSSPKQIPLR